MAIKITSDQNDRYRAYKSLTTAKGVKKTGQFLLSGRKTVSEAMSQTANKQGPVWEALLCTDATDLNFQVPGGVDIVELEASLFRELDEFGTKAPLAVGQVPQLPCYDQNATPEGLELLVPFGDPSNLGALIRSAEAFGVTKIVLLEEAAHPYHSKCLRASSGSVLRAPLFHGPSLNHLTAEVVALDLKGENIFEFQWPTNFRLLVGEEGPGFSQHPLNISHKVFIPMTGGVESLNAMVATGIALASATYRHE